MFAFFVCMIYWFIIDLRFYTSKININMKNYLKYAKYARQGQSQDFGSKVARSHKLLSVWQKNIIFPLRNYFGRGSKSHLDARYVIFFDYFAYMFHILCKTEHIYTFYKSKLQSLFICKVLKVHWIWDNRFEFIGGENSYDFLKHSLK